MTFQMQAFLVQVVVAISFCAGELTGIFQLPFSKFRTQSAGINTRAGMVVMYTLPIIAYVGLRVQAGSPSTLYHKILMAAFVGHFAKRILEVLFVHNYSRKTPIFAILNIAVAYTSVAVFASYFESRAAGTDHLRPVFWVGLGIFLVGVAVNLYHHILLARLRTKGSGVYVLPQAGLFHFVACPHYLAEIVTFIGYAMMANQLTTWGNALIVAVYLSSRSHSTLRWYQEKMHPPQHWRRLLPFVY